MPVTRRQTSILRIQIHWRSREKLRRHRARVSSSSLGIRKAAPLHIRQEIQTPNRPETTGNNPEPQPKRINAQITTTAEPSIPVRLRCRVHQRRNQRSSRLSQQTRCNQRQHQAAQGNGTLRVSRATSHKRLFRQS